MVDHITPYQAHDALKAVKLANCYQGTPPEALTAFVSKHLPQFDIATVSTYHHSPVIVLRQRVSGELTGVIRGTISWSPNPFDKEFWNVFSGEFWHNWGRNVTTHFFDIGRSDSFVRELEESSGGKIRTWLAHSKGGRDLEIIAPDGFKYAYNAHLVDEHPNGDWVSTGTRNDFLGGETNLGCGDHSAKGGKEGPGGIWRNDDWDDVRPGIRQGWNEQQQLETTTKRIKHELYEQERAKGTRFKNGHPKNEELRDTIKARAKAQAKGEIAQQRRLAQATAKPKPNPEASKPGNNPDEVAPDANPEDPVQVGETVSETPAPHLMDGVFETGAVYGAIAGGLSFGIRSVWGAVNWVRGVEKRSFGRIVGESAVEGTKDGVEIGLVAGAGQLLSNGLKMVGYGCTLIVPLTLQVWSSTKFVVSCLTGPRAQVVYIGIGEYLKYLVPVERLAADQRITGNILRQYEQAVANGEVKPGEENAHIRRLVQQRFQ